MTRAAPRRARHTPGSALRWLVWLAAAPAWADGAPIARVGDIEIDAATFGERAATVSTLDWAELGASWPERRRALLERVIIPDALLTLEAARSRAALGSPRDIALARAAAAALPVAPPSPAEIETYRARHQREFESPRALAVWRILVRTEDEARAALAKLAPLTSAAFSRLAREISIDHATHMRAGNLGLVAADGRTQMPELRVSPALFAAADGVRDGELVPEPVREGDAFAVVWRRGSRAAASAPPEQVRRVIEERLAEAARASALQALLDGLRREHLRDYHPEPARGHAPRLDPSVATPRRAPAPAELDSRTPHVVPQLTDRGLR